MLLRAHDSLTLGQPEELIPATSPAPFQGLEATVLAKYFQGRDEEELREFAKDHFTTVRSP